MALIHRFAVLFLCFSVLECVLSGSTESGVSEVVNALIERIETMELKMVQMEQTFHQKETIMQDQIDELMKTLGQSNCDTEEQSVDDNSDTGNKNSMPSKINRQGRNTRTNREVPETEVAFYATHSVHDVHHLGSDQPIPFQLPITNIGNAYNNTTGAFVAPVDGTYVIHATIRAIDTNHYDHLRAYIDINGVSYSTFWVSANDQSSQMLVIELKAGQTVTVKNSYIDNGFVGHHYSTFSGFLLYQHFPSGAIVG